MNFKKFIGYFDYDFCIKSIVIILFLFLFWKLGKLKSDYEEYFLIYWIINC